MDAIKHQCLELKTIEFFDTNFVSGYTKLEDFKHAQESYIHKGLRKIVDGFPSKIHDAIKKHLKIGKDNKCNILDEQRFRRFLQLGQHIIKDALVQCIKNNYYSLYRMIAGYLPDDIKIENAGNVTNIYNKDNIQYTSEELSKYRHTMTHIPKKQIPLFCIMLKINQTEDDFTFTLAPKELYDLFSSYFTKLLVDLDNIPDL